MCPQSLACASSAWATSRRNDADYVARPRNYHVHSQLPLRFQSKTRKRPPDDVRTAQRNLRRGRRSARGPLGIHQSNRSLRGHRRCWSDDNSRTRAFYAVTDSDLFQRYDSGSEGRNKHQWRTRTFEWERCNSRRSHGTRQLTVGYMWIAPLLSTNRTTDLPVVTFCPSSEMTRRSPR